MRPLLKVLLPCYAVDEICKGEDGFGDTELLFVFSEKNCKMIELVKGLAHTEVVGTCFIDVEETTEGVRAGSREC